MAVYRFYEVRWTTNDGAVADVLARYAVHKQKDLAAAKQRQEDLRLLFGAVLKARILSVGQSGGFEIKPRPFTGEHGGRGFSIQTEDAALAALLEKYQIGAPGVSGWRKRQAVERVFGVKTVAIVGGGGDGKESSK